ncbi:unnamed protein product [Miscanthus lutarioriparius]|uniref:Uncharacterized protein n=1 Tax=Miscanthus lutarioriparius TaxID=422564 RepID=A0A811PGC5_9POAL|nr:unnamed protein product [Miscanthus lutarioriparius]
MATTTKIIDIKKVCNNAHNIIDQLAKLDDKFFAINTSSSSLLPNAAVPLLLAAPRSDHATSSIAASLPCSGLATKLMNNDARPSNNERARSKEILDIRNMTNRWKTMFDEFFTRPDKSPAIADPPQPEIPTPEITYKGVAAASQIREDRIYLLGGQN